MTGLSSLVRSKPGAPGRAAHLGVLSFRSCARTHAGNVRSANEDDFVRRDDVALWAVADGMGGHTAGAIASRLVCSALSRVTDFGSAFAFRKAVRGALEESNRALVQLALDALSGPIGTTVVVLLSYEDHYACIWAGDSRAYIYRDGTLGQITRDHSLVQSLADAGRISSEDVHTHASAHVVTRAVGATDRLELDGVYGRLQPGDRLLLCSDGLSGVLDDRELATLLGCGDAERAADALMEKALLTRARDNVTAVVIDASIS